MGWFLDDPLTFQQAPESRISKEWITSMNDEICLMRKNQVWDLVDLLPGRKAITNKHVFEN